MVYGITFRLRGMKALAVTDATVYNCIGCRKTDGADGEISASYSGTVGTTAIKLSLV